MRLTSKAFEHNAHIPALYTCDGKNINPPLDISDVPEGAKSLALIVDDPDAVGPTGMVWDHWVIFNISPKTTEIIEGKEPTGVQGSGTSGNFSYSGPCPPDGEHRYFFKLYALDFRVPLPKGTPKAIIEKSMEGHILEQTELIGLYKKQQS